MEKDNIEEVLLGPIGSMPGAFDVPVLQYIHTRIIILQKAYPTTLEVSALLFIKLLQIQTSIVGNKKMLVHNKNLDKESRSINFNTRTFSVQVSNACILFTCFIDVFFRFQ